MTYQDAITMRSAPALPEIRNITPADLKDALAKGVDDFSAMPTHAVFLSLIYPIVGLALGRAMFGYDLVPLLYPLAAGFALLGPFAAIGLYELSRRREAGLDTSWENAFDVVRSPSLPAIVTLGLFLMVVFGIWVAIAHGIYIADFGYAEPTEPIAFLRRVLTTPAGHHLIIAGNFVGLLFAVGVFAVSAVSFPLLIDRDIGAVAAATTSVRVVLRNPLTMALWGVIIAALLAIGALPLLFGLAVAMPVLGHASWHLYRKVVVPAPLPSGERPHRHKGRRYAAEFPAALFTSYPDDRL